MTRLDRPKATRSPGLATAALLLTLVASALTGCVVAPVDYGHDHWRHGYYHRPGYYGPGYNGTYGYYYGGYYRRG
jgi:hypothetical protein